MKERSRRLFRRSWNMQLNSVSAWSAVARPKHSVASSFSHLKVVAITPFRIAPIKRNTLPGAEGDDFSMPGLCAGAASLDVNRNEARPRERTCRSSVICRFTPVVERCAGHEKYPPLIRSMVPPLSHECGVKISESRLLVYRSQKAEPVLCPSDSCQPDFPARVCEITIKHQVRNSRSPPKWFAQADGRTNFVRRL